MKFSTAWANVTSENHILKFVIIVLSGLSIFFSFAAIRMTLKDPVVIERSCYSKVLTAAEGKRSEREIQAFLEEALSQRFNTDARPHDAFLSDDELVLREKEQKELGTRKLRQRVVVNGLAIEKEGTIAVQADRIISVGDIRSAFRFPLIAKVESTTRTEGNPYGLVLEEVKAVQKGEKQ